MKETFRYTSNLWSEEREGIKRRLGEDSADGNAATTARLHVGAASAAGRNHGVSCNERESEQSGRN